MYDFNKVLLKPNIASIDSNTQRIRRNLIVASVIAYFFSVGSTGIDASSSFAGIKFDNLQIESIQVLILLALLYFLTHFIWATWDQLYENRLRLTGIVIPMARAGTYASSAYTLEPNTSDEKQSSILSWWKSQINLLAAYKDQLSSLEANIKSGVNTPTIDTIKVIIEELELKSSYIEESLIRFEKGFWKYQRSQLIRWILLDFGIPSLIGAVSVFLMCMELFC